MVHVGPGFIMAARHIFFYTNVFVAGPMCFETTSSVKIRSEKKIVVYKKFGENQAINFNVRVPFHG